VATGGGASRFPAIPDGGAVRRRRLKQPSEMRGPIWGHRGRGVLTGEPIRGGAVGGGERQR
jgi:hypothetical protein